MPYATSDDLVAKFGTEQLKLYADRNGDGALDADVLAAVIAEADAVVDLHVRGKYALPLSPVEPIITSIVCDLARRNLYGNATEVPDSVMSADKAARDLLKSISKGETLLAAAPPSPSDPVGFIASVEIEGGEPFFTRDNLKAF
jgi:phage gp36-like protein